MNLKDKNYKVFCYFDSRRVENGRTIISIKTLEEYCNVPFYTIQHLINLRRLIGKNHIDNVIDVLEKEFGLNMEKQLSKEEKNNQLIYELFN